MQRYVNAGHLQRLPQGHCDAVEDGFAEFGFHLAQQDGRRQIGAGDHDAFGVGGIGVAQQLPDTLERNIADNLVLRFFQPGRLDRGKALLAVGFDDLTRRLLDVGYGQAEFLDAIVFQDIHLCQGRG